MQTGQHCRHSRPISSPTHTLPSVVPACALQGGWQIPLHTGPPDREDPTFHAESLTGQPRVTCASLLIRIMKLDAARLAARRKLPNYADRSGAGCAYGPCLLLLVLRKFELGRARPATWHDLPDSDNAECACSCGLLGCLTFLSPPCSASQPLHVIPVGCSHEQRHTSPCMLLLHIEGRLAPCACLPAVQQQHLRPLRLT